MSEFTITRLVNHRAIVQGVDIFGVEGQTIIDTEQWEELVARDQHLLAHEEFDAAVEEFYAPLTTAADKVTETLSVPEDDIAILTLELGQEAVEGRDALQVRLTRGSVIMRLIEDNETDRLVWVDNDLEVLAASEVEDATFGEDPVDSQD